MTYEYMTGMGTTTVEQERLNQRNAQLEHERRLSQIQQGASGSIASLMASIGAAPPSGGMEQQSLCRSCYPEVIEPGRPTPPPRPSYPSRWRGSFADCAAKGGTTEWKSRSAWTDRLMEQVAVAPSFTPPPPGGVAMPSTIRATGCYQSGMSRIPTNQTAEGSVKGAVAQPLVREYQQCCYPDSFIQQKTEEARAQMDAYTAAVQAYNQSPAFLEYQEQLRQWTEQRAYEAAMQDRARALARGASTATPGSPCAPPEGGLVGKLPLPVPRTQADHLEQQLAFARLREQGCHSDERLFDLENMEVCCPPGVQVGPAPEPAPQTTPSNGNDGAAEPTRYFGFTAMQLAIGALGAGALYMLLKR